MATLKSLCCQRFKGAMTYAIAPANDFVGKKMSADVICTSTDVRMPVQVGEDRSRTWIFTRTPAGLDLVSLSRPSRAVDTHWGRS
jgi:hypothetical protein